MLPAVAKLFTVSPHHMVLTLNVKNLEIKCFKWYITNHHKIISKEITKTSWEIIIHCEHSCVLAVKVECFRTKCYHSTGRSYSFLVWEKFPKNTVYFAGTPPYLVFGCTPPSSDLPLWKKAEYISSSLIETLASAVQCSSCFAAAWPFPATLYSCSKLRVAKCHGSHRYMYPCKFLDAIARSVSQWVGNVFRFWR